MNSSPRPTFTGARFLTQPARNINSTIKTQFMYNNKIIKQEIAHDFFGVFASKDIKKGEIIFKSWNDNCVRLTRTQVDHLQEPYKSIYEKYCTELEEHTYVGPFEEEDFSDQIDYFINHCCDPNAWMINDGDVAARRDIKAAEQVTIDYATFVVNEIDSSRIDPCLCGSAKCRGKVGKEDWWLLRDVYKGHFIQWIQDKIDKRADDPALMDIKKAS